MLLGCEALVGGRLWPDRLYDLVVYLHYAKGFRDAARKDPAGKRTESRSGR